MIVDRLTKIINYKFVKVTINAFRLAKVMIDVVTQYHGLSVSIIGNSNLMFFFQVLFFPVILLLNQETTFNGLLTVD